MSVSDGSGWRRRKSKKVQWLRIGHFRGWIAGYFGSVTSVNAGVPPHSSYLLLARLFTCKHNSSHPKDCFTHGSIRLASPSACYLFSCFGISPYGNSVCQYLSAEKLERRPEGKKRACPRRFHSPCLYSPRSTHMHTHTTSYCPNQSLYRMLACQSGSR